MENSQSSKNNSLGKGEENPILRRWAEIVGKRGPETAILACDGAVLRTFDQIETEARQMADYFSEVPVGRLVSCQIGNSAAFPAFILAAWRAGCGVLPLDRDHTPLRRDRLEELCGAVFRLDASGIVLLGGGIPDPASPVSADLLKVTSGSTGEPRTIRFSAAQLLADADAICDTMGLRETDINYGAIAFSHSYGFSNLVTPLLGRGIPLVAASDMMPRAVMDGLAASGATVFPGVPALFRLLSELTPPPLPLRLCISAGAPLTPEIAAGFFRAWGRKIHSFYGASECGGMCYDSTEEPAPPRGFVGTPLRGVTLEHREDGSITVRSAAVGTGYFPSGAGDALGQEAFSPSDLLEWSDCGYVIKGRMSDVINVGGRKVNPAEIERVIQKLPGVREVVVLSLPSPLRGEEVAACVAGTITEDFLRQQCGQALPAWQVPRHWFLWAEIPVNSRGKISRADLRSRLLGGKADN